jgi:2-polyprenyl-3-methyl-5-hydroxy-6-metoxy-1,4-benzoquinol methylase
MSDHDRALAEAFDAQAERFERAPVQSDPAALARLAAFAALPPRSFVLDAGCGPGLVAEAFLNEGHTVLGVDLSPEMVLRARRRCERFGGRATFQENSAYDLAASRPFDAAVSRYVVHHVTDQPAFVRRMVELVRPGGVVVVCDHATDPDPGRAAFHEELERARDTTHTRNLTAGGLADLLAGAGLSSIRMEEESFALDFDEWFDRGTPAVPKAEVRARLLGGPPVRGFRATSLPGGAVRINCVRALVRGVKPVQGA